MGTSNLGEGHVKDIIFVRFGVVSGSFEAD